MQQSRELLQQSLAAVPLRSPVIIHLERSSERLHNLPASASIERPRWIEVELNSRIRPSRCSRKSGRFRLMRFLAAKYRRSAMRQNVDN
jgi:hypothetical protein